MTVTVPVTMPPVGPQLSVGIRNFAARAPQDWRHVLDQARAADEAGVDRVFVADHLVFGADLSSYADPASGGVVGGVQPTGPDGDWLEPLTALTAMAAVTERVLLATNILVAPLRPAVLLAKTAATIDVLSHGRFELGVGLGWQEAEYRALGVDFHRRGALLDQQLEACRELWTAEVAQVHSRDLEIDGAQMMPKPTRPGGVPVWIGGRPVAAAARRLARHGDGWVPWGADPDNYASLVAQMRELVESEGRDFATVQLSFALPTHLTDERRLDLPRMFEPVPALVAAGVHDFRVMPRLAVGIEPAREQLAELVEAFGTITGRTG